MRVLSMTHGPDVRAEVFGDVVVDEGHELEEWSLVDEDAPPRALDEYDAVLVFGGAMNVGEEAKHPWLQREYDVLRALVDRGVPLLGVCLGGQTLASATGAEVRPSPEPEHGFVRVELTDAAREDAVFSRLPREFDAFQGHSYAFAVPPGAVELARSRVCSQAFRVGDCAWGIQFHPEVRPAQVGKWLDEELALPRERAERVRAELAERSEEWQRFGEGLCRAFLDVAKAQASRYPSSSVDRAASRSRSAL